VTEADGTYPFELTLRGRLLPSAPLRARHRPG
jgi:hypothetical protein